MANEPNSAFATSAAKVFLQRCPSYVVNKTNSAIMAKELIRLVEEEDCDAANVDTYVRAFQNCLGELEVREPEPRKSVEEMTPEELSKLSPTEQEKLPSNLLRKLANYELTQRRQKPTLDEHSAALKNIFEELDVAFSPANTKIIHEWMDSRQLGYSPANIRLAIIDNESRLELSEQAIDQMSSAEYRKEVLEPKLRASREAQSKPQSRVPFGVQSYSSFLHNQ
jgi:hypothetical protein